MALPSNADLPNYPFPNVARTYDFEFLRMAIANFTGEGVTSTASLAVTTGSSGLSLSVAAGTGFVFGDDRATQGVYMCYAPIATTVTCTAAHATNPRIDRVVLRVYDADVTGAENKWAIEIIAGTATGGATLTNLTGATAVPNGAMLLANILVPATFTGPFVNATHIQDRRVGSAGRSTLTSAYLPDSPVDGQIVDYQTSAMRTAGVLWRFRYDSAWSADAYKWAYLGGTEWVHEVATLESRTNTAFGELTTPNEITIPSGISGKFKVGFGANLYASSNTPADVYYGLSWSAVAVADDDSIQHTSAANNYSSSVARIVEKTIAGGTRVHMQAKNSGTAQGNYRRRFLSVVPVRVG